MSTGCYKGQISTLLAYINSVIMQDWTGRDAEFRAATSVNRFAEVASMSKRNLQIVFHAYMHESVGAYKNRLRLEYAQQLLKTENISIAEVSDIVGFANPSAFNNEFKKHYYQSPSERQHNLLCLNNISEHVSAPSCRISYLDSIPVIYISYIGSYDYLYSSADESDSWSMLDDFAKSHGILSPDSDYWGIAFDDNDITDDDKCRFYSALKIKDSSFHTSITSEVKKMNLPKGRYAVYAFKGDYRLLGEFYDLIFRTIDFPVADSPILERYINSPYDVPASELLTEIWVPIAG